MSDDHHCHAPRFDAGNPLAEANIRRAFWLTVGAVGGIMGYRRAVSLGRQVKGRSVTRDAVRVTREVQSFSRDVREGMELYSARRPHGVAPTLRAVPPGGATQPPGGATPRTPRGHTRSKTDRIGHATNNYVNEKDDR